VAQTTSCGREEVCSSKTDNNVSKINNVVRKKRPLNIRMIAEMVNKPTVRQILQDHLNTTKICAKIMPKNLTREQKGGKLQIWPDILGRIKDSLIML